MWGFTNWLVMQAPISFTNLCNILCMSWRDCMCRAETISCAGCWIRGCVAVLRCG